MILRPVRPSAAHRRCSVPLLAILALLPSPRAALARAHYDHSTPAIGQVLAAAPPRLEIYTDSEMRKLPGANVISVTGADGGTTVLDDANRQHFSVGLRPNLPPERYVVSFQPFRTPMATRTGVASLSTSGTARRPSRRRSTPP